MLCRPSIENTLKWDLPELKLGRNWESAGDFVPSTTEQHFNLALAWSTQGTMFICSMPVSMVKYCQRTLKHWTCIVIVILTLNCRSYVTPQIFFSLFLCEASKTDGWHLVMTSALLKCEGYFELDLLLCVVTYTVLECSACYLLTVHIIWKSTCTVRGFFFRQYFQELYPFVTDTFWASVTWVQSLAFLFVTFYTLYCPLWRFTVHKIAIAVSWCKERSLINCVWLQ